MLDWFILAMIVVGVLASALFLYPYPIEWGDEAGRDRARGAAPFPGPVTPPGRGDARAAAARAFGPAEARVPERSREPAL